MLETPWGVFQVEHAKSFDLSGIEAMSVQRFQRYGRFRENFYFSEESQNLTSEPPLYLYLYLYVRICICIRVFVFVFVYLYLYLIMTTF